VVNVVVRKLNFGREYSDMKKRTIAVVTGSRADYGHLYWLMRSIKEDPRLSLQVMVTGSHLSSNFGLTYKEIVKDGFSITAKVPILSQDNSEAGVVVSVGKGCIGFSKIFKKYKPDMMVVLGDRFEILSATIAAYILKIPVVHVHGGEVTRGIMDEGIRHSITKMSGLHCTSTKTYQNRVIQMGEDPRCVYYTGAPGLDQMYHLNLLTKKQLALKLGFNLSEPVLLVTYHPVTLGNVLALKYIREVLKAIALSGFQAIFTKANADPEGLIINKEIKIFCQSQPQRYRLFDNLGQLLYYSCLKHFSLMVGNSSSGLIEAPSFGMPVVNIGDRQQDRVKGINVIDVPCHYQNILKGIQRAVSPDFYKSLQGCKNPYERYRDGKTSWRIKEMLRTISFNKLMIKKKFFDLNAHNSK